MPPYPVFKVNFLTSPIKKGFSAAWAQSAGKASSWFYPGLDLARESVLKCVNQPIRRLIKNQIRHLVLEVP